MKSLTSTLLFAMIATLSLAQETTILPISLKNFTVDLKDQAVEVKWDIIHQNDALGYNIEHSLNGKDWQVIAYFTETGNDKYKTFSYRHNNAGNGRQYYRIRLNNAKNGLYYSEVKTIAVKNKTVISVWPNPAQESIHIQNNNVENKLTRAVVFNQNGVKIIELKLTWGINKMDIQKLNAGNYFIRVEAGSNNAEVAQFVKN